MALPSQPIVAGDSINFAAVITKDGLAWDITQASVTLYLMDPSGIVTPYACAVTDGPNGKANYQVGADVLYLPGDWRRQWVVRLSGLALKSKIIEFPVLPAVA